MPHSVVHSRHRRATGFAAAAAVQTTKTSARSQLPGSDSSGHFTIAGCQCQQ